MAVLASSMAEDCIAPYTRGCNAQNPCCRNMMCTIAMGHEEGLCTHWLAQPDDADYCKHGCEACCDKEKVSQFGGFHCVPMEENRGMCMPWLDQENAIDFVTEEGCTPGCEACCHNSGSRYALHCVKRPGTDRGSCQHWLTEEVGDLKPGCLIAGEKGCVTSHDCCGVTGSLDGLVCHKDTGVCHPLLPDPYPLPPFSQLSASNRDPTYCKPGCETCCDEDEGSQFGGFHCMPLDETRGMCMPWFEQENNTDFGSEEGCTPGCEACCFSSGLGGLHCVVPLDKEMGICVPWLAEDQTKMEEKDNKGKDTCVDGYGCQDNSECCQLNYICLHSVGKEYGTCMPIMASNAPDFETESDSGCSPGCESCCHGSGSWYKKHCVRIPGTDQGSCRHWLQEEGTKGEDTCVQGYGCQEASECCHQHYQCLHTVGKEFGTCMPWLS